MHSVRINLYHEIVSLRNAAYNFQRKFISFFISIIQLIKKQTKNKKKIKKTQKKYLSAKFVLIDIGGYYFTRCVILP